MQLSFGKRQGDHLNWQRTLVVRVIGSDGAAIEHGPFWLKMQTQHAAKKDEFGVEYKGAAFRTGEILAPGGKQVWSGKIGSDATPLRALAVAAGLCDADGNSEIPIPAWLKG
jgi:hypothetical protein